MLVNDAKNRADLEIMQNLCANAAKIAMQYFGKNPKIWIKEGDSPVSEADFAVDNYLKQHLLAARPDYGWISEETEDTREIRDYQRYFVVDPIDGTRGFLDGSAYWCISVAVVENGRPVAAVLHCPVHDEVYAALYQGGATYNDVALPKLSKNKNFSHISATRGMETKIKNIQQNLNFVHHIPSLACRIALAAKGEIDVVLIRPNCHDWDIAAADLILSETGGRLLDLKKQKIHYGTSPYAHNFLFACENSQIDTVLDIVEKANLV